MKTHTAQAQQAATTSTAQQTRHWQFDHRTCGETQSSLSSETLAVRYRRDITSQPCSPLPLQSATASGAASLQLLDSVHCYALYNTCLCSAETQLQPAATVAQRAGGRPHVGC